MLRKGFSRLGGAFLVTASVAIVAQAPAQTLAEAVETRTQANGEGQSSQAEVDQLISLVTAARVVRDRMGVSWKQNLDFVVRCADAEVLETVESVKDRAMALGRVATLTAGTKVEKPATASTVVEDGLEIFIPLEGLIDLDAERARLEKEIAQHEGWLKGIAGKLSNAGFVANAPADVVERERSRQGDLEEKLGRLRDNRAELG